VRAASVVGRLDATKALLQPDFLPIPNHADATLNAQKHALIVCSRPRYLFDMDGLPLGFQDAQASNNPLVYQQRYRDRSLGYWANELLQRLVYLLILRAKLGPLLMHRQQIGRCAARFFRCIQPSEALKDRGTPAHPRIARHALYSHPD
jgi:hypothetical protein